MGKYLVFFKVEPCQGLEVKMLLCSAGAGAGSKDGAMGATAPWSTLMRRGRTGRGGGGENTSSVVLLPTESIADMSIM